MKIKIFIKSFFLFTISACTHSGADNIQFSDFKQEIKLTANDGKEINAGEILSKKMYLYLLDDILIAHDPVSTDNSIHFFKNKQYLSSIGKIGEGPNEISRPGPISVDDQRDFLWVADCGRLDYRSYNVSEILKSGSKAKYKKFNYKKNFSHEFRPINDTSILCMTMGPPFLFEILSENGETKLFDVRRALGPNVKFEHSMVTFTVEPKTNHIFMAFRFLDAIIKLDKFGNIVFTKVFFDKIGFDKPVNPDHNKEINTFSRMKIFGEKVFVLYCGLEFFRYGNVGQPTANHPDKLMVFDFDGNPLKLITFDFEIWDYVYDEKNNELLVYSLSNEIYPIKSFDLEL
jgi:hypothetical protein